ncbi:MAG: hypothetical protein JWQ75_1371, partial [Pseudarthrobacter sp.]|nr:hypothetical protein [Pseudarthrobacter sp.]
VRVSNERVGHDPHDKFGDVPGLLLRRGKDRAEVSGWDCEDGRDALGLPDTEGIERVDDADSACQRPDPLRGGLVAEFSDSAEEDFTQLDGHDAC